MKELVKTYINDSLALMRKQSAEIAKLRSERRETEATRLRKAAVEDNLHEIRNCLSNEQYTPESVVDAVLEMDAGKLEKQAELGELDSLGELESISVNNNNLRPSEYTLYSRMGLI